MSQIYTSATFKEYKEIGGDVSSRLDGADAPSYGAQVIQIFFLECLVLFGIRNRLTNEIISPPGKRTRFSIINKHSGCPSVCSKFSWM